MIAPSLARDIVRVARRRPNDPVVTWTRADGRAVRYTSRFDDESEYFERELVAQPIVPCCGGLDHELTSERGNVDLPLQQSHGWLRHTNGALRVLQIRDAAGRPSMQAVVQVRRPRYLPWLGHGVVHRMGHATTGADEEWALRLLRALCSEDGDLVTLRIQPRRIGVHALCDVEARARRAGFRLVDPEDVTRTLLLDLRASDDALFAGISIGAQLELRARERSAFEVRAISCAAELRACATLARAARGPARASVGPILALLATEPSRVRAVGVFHRDRPDEPLAVAAATRDGEMAELSWIVSDDSPELLEQPFEHWLVWSLASWARSNGARHLDLGGIGGDGDDYKRDFTHWEVEVGRELVALLHPFADVATRTIGRMASG